MMLAPLIAHSLNSTHCPCRLPTSFIHESAVNPFQRAAYCPKGEMDPHAVDPARPGGKLPEQCCLTQGRFKWDFSLIRSLPSTQ